MDNIIDKTMFNSEKINVNIDIDRIKILEFASNIDEWENQNLFSQGGFYSLKGKDALGKTEELLDELNQELEIRIGEIEFNSTNSRQVAETIKAQKLDTIKIKMLEFEEEQKKQYSFEVIENSLKSIKDKALKYKFNPDIVNKSYFNALNVLFLFGELKQLNKKELKKEIESFNSDFFENLVWGYIEEHSLEAEEFFNKNKHYILKDHYKEIEIAIKNLKNNIASFEIAKQMFEDNVEEKEALKDISKIEDEDTKAFAKIYFNCLNRGKKNLLEADKKNLVNKVWENIDFKLNENSDEALFEVNLHQDKQVIEEQISYIKQMTKLGEIFTNEQSFFELYQLAFEDCRKFSDINLNNYKANLSSDDLNYFKYLQEKIKDNEFLILKDDYFLLSKYFAKDTKQNVDLIKSFHAQCKEYEKINKKAAFGEQKIDIIEYLKNIYLQKNRVSNTKK